METPYSFKRAWKPLRSGAISINPSLGQYKAFSKSPPSNGGTFLMACSRESQRHSTPDFAAANLTLFNSPNLSLFAKRRDPLDTKDKYFQPFFSARASSRRP